MNIDELLKSDKILFSTLAGSHCYGLNIETSDEDMVGIFHNPPADYMKFDEPPTQISDNKQDNKYYELKETFRLLIKGSPNIIEMLFIDERFHRHTSPTMKKLIANRPLFISQKLYFSFTGYAFQQIKKAKGQNKWINNPKPTERPQAIDYISWIPANELNYQKDNDNSETFACRPRKLESSQGYLLSRIEHGLGSHRMYKTDKQHDFLNSGKIICSSIDMEAERQHFAGILYFNESLYNRDFMDWKNYWQWKKKRNEARWVKQESGELDYDAKNMAHCMRLLISGKHILTHAEPKVFFDGEQRQYLLDIRLGKFSYEEIIAEAEQLMIELNELKKEMAETEEPLIPKNVDREKIIGFYEELQGSILCP